MRAVAQSPSAAALMGIDVNKIIGRTFILGGALGGFASVIYALYNNTIHFQMGFRVGMDAFTAAVLGGIGNLGGSDVRWPSYWYLTSAKRSIPRDRVD